MYSDRPSCRRRCYRFVHCYQYPSLQTDFVPNRTEILNKFCAESQLYYKFL